MESHAESRVSPSQPEREPIGVGIVGLGFMGRVHFRAFEAARREGYPCRVVAVCDRDARRREGFVESGGNLANEDRGNARLFDPAEVRGHATADDLLADPGVHAVSICTHTDMHADLAIAALRAGKHVLVEKPLAVRREDAERVASALHEIDAAKRPGERLVCLPAMCMRFWPGWAWLKDRVSEGCFGPVISATFHRLGSPPGWASEFYRDPARTGGALVDLHIHDADFVRWLFGDPRSVVSAGTIDHATTIYRYEAGGPPHVVAEGGWDHTPGFAFRMRYVVLFERATADFDFTRQPQLMLARDGRVEEVPLDPRPGYDFEVRHFIDAARDPASVVPRATVDDAVAVTRLLVCERRSLETRSEIQVGG